MTTVVISQPMYFPWAGFFEQMRLADIYVWLDDAQFSKGSFTNRVQVLMPGPSGLRQHWMTIPLSAKTAKVICELAAKDDAWRISHRDLLAQSLQRMPHADRAMAIFAEAMAKDTVCDIVIASAEATARALQCLPRTIYRSSELAIPGKGSDRVLAMVRALGGTRYVTGHGAANYLDNDKFEAAGIAVEFMSYNVRPWDQRGATFTPYVTALDLIATQGDTASEHLRPATTSWLAFNASEAQ
ncbi:MAG: WbqC family protein [Hyphomicrobiaceae bacterium]